jgi:phosphatidylinositol alpha-mannosyltransferase
MRVALVCPYDLDAAGGVQVHLEDLASQLVARGHLVEILGPGRGGLGRPVRFAYRGTVAPIAPWPGGLRLVRQAFERFSPDIVHVHEPFTPSASMWAALAATVPVVATFHAWLDRARVYEAAGPALRPVARRLTATIAVSQAAASFVERAVPGLDPVVIPNGVSVARFADAPRRDWPRGRRIAWAHRLDPQKGFPVLVEAFRRLAFERADLLLSVGGDGTDRVAVEGLPAPVRERVSMFGRVAHEEVPSLLAGADVAVAAATGQESFGIALVEAMAAGVPVVATDIEGYREVATDGVDALLVAPGDDVALAAAIARVLDDGDLAARLRAAGRDTAAAFDWNLVTDRIVERYRWALGRASLR